jgi:hypothetical protein
VRTSRPRWTLEPILDSTDASHRGDAPRHFATKGDEVERKIDGFRFGIHSERSPGGVKLSLIHHDVLANPSCPIRPSAGRDASPDALRPFDNLFGH